MPRLRGLQAEILVSLAVVMATATGLLAATLARSHAEAAAELAALAGRALVVDARSPLYEAEPEPGA
ncbi:MAG TPA: hypothetical protein VFC77_12610, partial [Myxococcota bacterium]|nr:hypothetical protein [Myxococcota bacterium]